MSALRQSDTLTRRLRILMLMAALPYPPIWGTGLRNFHLLRFLAPRHDVTLVTYAAWDDRGAVTALNELGVRSIVQAPPRQADGLAKRRQQFRSLLSRRSYHSSTVFSPTLQRALDDVVAAGAFDVIQIQQSTMGQFELRHRDSAIVVLDEHNIEFEVLRRSAAVERSPIRKLYYLNESFKHRREEIRTWREASGCTLTSAREQRLLHEIVPDKPTAVIANSVDVTYFTPSGQATDPDELVFTGLMSYRPNVDAMVHFVDVVLPLIQRARPRVHLTIVGAGPSPEIRRLAGPSVHVTGAVDDVRPYLQRAAVVVVPVRMGSGTRFKVTEGLAMGKAVVSTTVGAEGIGVRDGEHVLLADEPAQFAAAVLGLLDDTRLARSLGARGRELAERELSWESAGGRLEMFYSELARHSAGLARRPQPHAVYGGSASA